MSHLDDAKGRGGEKGKARSVLFVCSGNVFRSVSAERIVKARVSQEAFPAGLRVSSAGTHAIPQLVRPEVSDYLKRYRIDVADHMPRRVDETILAETDLVVSMSYDHRTFLKERFGQSSMLFNEIAVGADTPILDVGEATPPWRDDPVVATAHATRVIDYLWEVMPQFLDNLVTVLSGTDLRSLAASGAA